LRNQQVKQAFKDVIHRVVFSANKWSKIFVKNKSQCKKELSKLLKFLNICIKYPCSLTVSLCQNIILYFSGPFLLFSFSSRSNTLFTELFRKCISPT
jgi:hypothetical protein